MTLKRYLLIFSFLFSAVLGASASQHLLSSNDVRKIMDQLFEYHIDYKSITPEVVARSLKIYVTQFDPNHSYLLEEEVRFYLNPTDQFISTIIQDYQRDRFGAYFSLNDTICHGIHRAREWRAEWEGDPVWLVAEAMKTRGIKLEKEDYASNVTELQTRYFDRFVRYLSYLMEELGYPSYKGMEGKLVNLCEKQLADFENGYLSIAENGKRSAEKEQEHQIVQRTLKALAHSLDAHTAYFSPEEAYAMKVQLEKGMCGIGVVLREGIEGVVIQDMLKGGPAQQSGEIVVGDTIVEVDGKSVKAVSFRHVLEVMRGKEGTKTTLGIFRPETQQFKRVILTRSKIALEEHRVEYATEPFADGMIGKITLHSFYEGENGVSTEQDLRRAITELQERGKLYGLVIDMRDNSGGFLSQAIKVTGLFISNGVVVISKYSDGSVKYYRTVDGKRLFDGPLVLLVSKTSASATEIVAQALQDYGVAVVVGDEKTYGKGTIQHQTVTDDASRSFFKVTIGRYYTVSGRSTQIDGVRSDVVVPTELHLVDIGENHLDFPLPADRVAPAYNDDLSDVDPFAKRWFTKNYLPNLQPRETRWIEHLPTLQENSSYRQSKSKNFQIFLSDLKEKGSVRHSGHGKNDLQLDESVNILKDMIFLAK